MIVLVPRRMRESTARKRGGLVTSPKLPNFCHHRRKQCELPTLCLNHREGRSESFVTHGLGSSRRAFFSLRFLFVCPFFFSFSRTVPSHFGNIFVCKRQPFLPPKIKNKKNKNLNYVVKVFTYCKLLYLDVDEIAFFQLFFSC